MAFGVYIHFPYCFAKCPYCDFASVAAARIPHRRYARAVAAELALRADRADGRRAASLYLGGGTPSLWQPPALEETLDAVRKSVDVDPDAEVTLEANPGASDTRRFRAFRRLGINRLSIGVQSFDPAVLAALGRRHGALDSTRAFLAAREAEFVNVGLDLIHGAPGQSVAMAVEDAERAVALGPEHLSCYALTLDHLAVDVPMARATRAGRIAVPDDEEAWRMALGVREALECAGLRRYEISNFARPGREARHNRLYWTGGEYLGLGAGASGFSLEVPGDPSRGGVRWSNDRDPARYLALVEDGRLPETSRERLDAKTLLSEAIALGLRLVEGVDLKGLSARHDCDPTPHLAAAADLARRGLARLDGHRLALTDRGLDFHTEAASAFV